MALLPEDTSDATGTVSTECPAVVLIVFNRPDLTEQVFAAVRRARPSQLLIVADGPRDSHPTDAQLCDATRAVVGSVDWPCDVLRKYSEGNLGCGPSVSQGIGWALDQVGEALILEDDCLPDPSLFPFCAELLDRYRSDDRIMQIAGSNWAAPTDAYLGYSYGFNSFSPVWGWATWRRAWDKFDFDMRTWPWFRENMVRGLPFERGAQAVLVEYWDRAHAGNGTWDHQWQYAVMSQHGLSVSPSVNLVSNLGFRADATQTVLEGDLSNIPARSMAFPLRHPPVVTENPLVERHFDRQLVEHGGRGVELLRRLVPSHRLRRALKQGLRVARGRRGP